MGNSGITAAGGLVRDREGFKEVELETDSISVVSKIKHLHATPGSHSKLLDAIKEAPCKTMAVIYQEANACADWMATHFDHLDLGLHTFDVPPQGISSLLTVDTMRLVWP
ncbi:hypothetical protein CCACVL1_29073 [Corchorus capsularis]|uniref:RNase H type-1 domain-containing protein n=1 Tax=Corchorus capsularis TaxID=210143 RepID=A0A1R3G417_COCAP|nr:hypothetical protein CCACVL1_29073 [Corchorus capsularis]